MTNARHHILFLGDFIMVEEYAARVRRETLARFCQQVFLRLGVVEQDAAITADALVTADLRGVASHGVAHLRRYVEGLKAGTIVARPRERQVAETLATATVD